DRYTVKSHALNLPITARYIRVHTITLRSYIAMRVDFYGCISVSSNPVAFFSLNGQYETTDASHSHNPSGKVSNLESASWPDGNMGGSYQFWGNLTSFIQFPNLGGLDTRYSMTLLAWIYHEQIKGPI
ncbi:unnamed protein product, partial [Pocillopora meandrina]